MGVINRKPADPGRIESTMPSGDSQIESITLTGQEIGYDALTSDITGTPWVVDYYNTYLKKDDVDVGYDPELSPVYSQYYAIYGLEILLTQSLTTNIEENSNIAEVTGSANVVGWFTPSKSDVLIGTLPSGKKALMKVTSYQRNALTKNTSYSINFSVVSDVTEEMLLDLDHKSIRKFRYDKDRQLNGNNPIIKEEAYVRNKGIEISLDRLMDSYLADFFNDDLQTVSITLNDKVIYDNELVLFLLKVVNRRKFNKVNYLRTLDDRTVANNNHTLWDSLLDGTSPVTKRLLTKYGLTDRSQFAKNGSISNLRYVAIDYLVTHLGNDSDPAGRFSDVGEECFDTPTLSDYINMKLAEKKDCSDCLDVFSIDRYILSSAYYEGITTCPFEVMVHEYITNGIVNPDVLSDTLGKYVDLNDLTRYYIGPILYYLGTRLNYSESYRNELR